MTKSAFFRKLMSMLVFPEDLNKKCQVLDYLFISKPNLHGCTSRQMLSVHKRPV